MNISSIDSSLRKYLYDNLTVPLGIEIFDSVYYVNFDAFDTWVVMDALSHTTTSIPRSNYFLHISLKEGLLNSTVVLNRLCDTVTKLINPGVRIDVYDDVTEVLVGEMEICETSLAPVLQHAGGGSFRSLSVGIVYAGEIYS